MKRRDQKPPGHNDKEVRKIVAAVLKAGWAVEHPGSHAWGWLCCSGVTASKPECRVKVMTTPKGDSQAKVLRRAVARCPHGRAVRT